MARFEDLPADQKAVLQLVLRQGRSYAEIGQLLKISPEAVRHRAHTALAALAPDEPASVERQDEVGDYLLGQQSPADAEATQTFLAAWAPARAWAAHIAGELQAGGIAQNGALPELPRDDEGDAPTAAGGRGPITATPRRSRAARTGSERSSKLGGVLLIGGVGIVVVLALLLIFGVIGGGGNGDQKSAATTATTSTQPSSGTSIEAQINMTPPGQADGGPNKTLGVANIASQDGKRAIAIVGQNLPPSGHYVLWLRNGAKVKFLGFFPVVKATGADKGRLQGLVAAPSDLNTYNEILVSREPSSTPKSPTKVVLTGKIAR